MSDAINTLFTLLVVAIFMLFFVRLIENAHNTGGVASHNHHHRGKHHGHWYY